MSGEDSLSADEKNMSGECDKCGEHCLECRCNNKCKKCGAFLNLGCTVHNVPSNCKERITFPYMSIGESMHMECYIQHVIDVYLEFKMKNESVTK